VKKRNALLNSESSIIEFEGVGLVRFEKSRRARRLTISIRPDKGVRVAIPRGLSFARAKDYVDAKRGWIRKHLDKLEKERQQHEVFTASLVPIEKEDAKKRLISQVAELAKKHGFHYNRIFIRNQRTRWGSCSVKNNINLNIKLASLPQDLADYVILHELVHTRIKNHGKAFWKTLDRLMNNSKEVDKRLKAYRLVLL
jgi:predicted metal-dependent hydrolase